MSTYAALVSLHRILEGHIDPGGLGTFNRALLRSIHKLVNTLLDSLENPGRESQSTLAVERNTRLRDAADMAEDAIESHLSESSILGSDPKRKAITKAYFFIIFGIGVAYLLPQNPEGISASIGGCMYIAGFVYLFYRYIVPDIITRPRNYVLDNESWDPKNKELTLVLGYFTGIQEDFNKEISAYATLVSLRRTLDSALDSDGYNRAQLRSLHDNVSFLLDIYSRSQGTNSRCYDATITHAAYEANTIIKFRIPAKFPDSAMTRIRRAMTFRFEALPMFVSFTFVLWIAFHYVIPFMGFSPQNPLVLMMGYVSNVCLSYPVLRFLYKFALWRIVGAYYLGGDDVAKLEGKLENEALLHLFTDNLAKCVNKIKDACGNPSTPQQSSSPRRESGGTGNSNVVVGLDMELQQIKDHLLNIYSSQREVISIGGMGGIGKTTLATLAYNDSDIRSHFDIHAWVSVSQEYSLPRVLLCILDSAKLLPDEMLQGEEDDSKLGLHLYQSLLSRRYLIVMDDVWDTEIWDSITIYLPQNNNGSRILLTSRLTDAASYPKSSIPLLQMQCLNEAQSWCLLREKVFGVQDRPLGSELESNGRKIAKKCRGLPLAIVVIGGLLYKDNRHEIWREVARNLNSNLQAELSEVLGLSYDHLPHNLRPCFLYMGAFPRGSEIPVSKLISLWVADGFLRPQTSKSLEEIAEEYLNDLIDRNLILVGKRSCNGKIRTCSIHDLLWDVSVQNAQKENFLQVVNTSGHLIPQTSRRITRRLSICRDALQELGAIHNELTSCGYVRSLLFTGSIKGTSVSYIVLLFKYLRVLDVAVMKFGEFPDYIIQLIHLRYLAFHYNGSIPPSISKLSYLETIVHHCSHRRYPLLPGVIWSMPNLRHLYVKPGSYLSNPLGFHLPWNISILQHLQTLMGIRNFKWSKGIVKRIPSLKKLGIFYDVSSFVDWSTYQLECLSGLSQLEVLKITVNYDDLQSCDPPSKLAFPQKLKKLSLRGCGIPWASMTTIGALPNLQALKLRHEACFGPSWETAEGEFPKLMFLMLENISLESWETDEHHFPLLQRLVLRSCGKLEEIPRAIGDIPTLEMIELVACHPSAVVSAKEIQEEQEGIGNDLKLHIC